MYDEYKYRLIKEGIVLVDHGPITMTIKAVRDNEALTDAAIKAAENVILNFQELIPFLEAARSSMGEIKKLKNSNYPLVLKKMIESVCQLDEDDFTPMAAVAGTLSDLAKEEALRNNADFVIANNGGDISFGTCPENDFLKVGIVSDLSKGKVTHLLKIDRRSQISGIATSGWGGRSLTKGVASAVTALAKSSSYADAAATSIANFVNCDDAAIERCLAEELDYQTDIRGSIVTKSVGVMEEESVDTALKVGLERAKQLYDKGMILGAIIFVQGKMVIYPDDSKDFYIDRI